MNRDVNAVRRPRRTESRRGKRATSRRLCVAPHSRNEISSARYTLNDLGVRARDVRLDECAKFRASMVGPFMITSMFASASDQSRDRIIPVSVYHLADV